MSSIKKSKPLFVVCPECHLEHKLQAKYGDDIVFISALGGLYQFESFDEYEEVSQLISNQNINRIYIVNSHHCSFFQNVIVGKKLKATYAEDTLNNLYFENIEALIPLNRISEKIRLLSSLFLKSQGQKFLDSPLLGDRIESGELECIGLFIDHEYTFNEVPIYGTTTI
ncbi:hypothetical protein [Reichenbachiella agariperforans]|uniref:Carbonic anhydrase n=1 Tax=Reichenbachiella agariperforans TaxID=156994 RepID=A0A1M6PSC5_REIAG|nr:hypothetical protein [Reichenbachiella agariperforans]MBU2912947.1 hypothetical protein [Reichenbachiella agariperforans]SHK10778.1 hypothetical protein SAMN04488028_10312 [Reichenbachiella agariperforans]